MLLVYTESKSEAVSVTIFGLLSQAKKGSSVYSFVEVPFIFSFFTLDVPLNIS